MQTYPLVEGGYTEAEVDKAIGSYHMALELLQRRYAASANDELIFADRQADCLLNQGIFVGPEITKAQAHDAAEIKLSIDEKHTMVSTLTYLHKHQSTGL